MASRNRGRATCKRAHKVILRTELDAKIALAGRAARDKGEVRYYQCPYGDRENPHYHLTSQKEH